MTSRWADDLVEHAEGLDEHTRHKAGFYVKQIANALSPSNFIAHQSRSSIARPSPPTARTWCKGMKMLAEDIAAGKGDLQAAPDRLRRKFEVGDNMAMTPGKVVAAERHLPDHPV